MDDTKLCHVISLFHTQKKPCKLRTMLLMYSAVLMCAAPSLSNSSLNVDVPVTFESKIYCYRNSVLLLKPTSVWLLSSKYRGYFAPKHKDRAVPVRHYICRVVQNHLFLQNQSKLEILFILYILFWYYRLYAIDG